MEAVWITPELENQDSQAGVFVRIQLWEKGVPQFPFLKNPAKPVPTLPARVCCGQHPLGSQGVANSVAPCS